MRGFVELTDSDGDSLFVRADLLEIMGRYEREQPGAGWVTQLDLTGGRTRFVTQTPGEIAALLEAAEEQSATATGLDPLAIDVQGELRALVSNIFDSIERGEKPHPADLAAFREAREILGVRPAPTPGTFEWVLEGMREGKAFNLRSGLQHYRLFKGASGGVSVDATSIFATDWQEVPAAEGGEA